MSEEHRWERMVEHYPSGDTWHMRYRGGWLVRVREWTEGESGVAVSICFVPDPQPQIALEPWKP